MRIKTIFCKEVDLDNPETYLGMSTDISKLKEQIHREIGYATCYMIYHSDVYDGIKCGGQKQRVEKLIFDYALNERTQNDMQWYQEQLLVFQDEVENMCF